MAEDIPNEDRPHGWQIHLDEMQAEINRRLTENLHGMEHGDIMQLARIQDIDEAVRERQYPKPQKRRR